MEMPKPHSKPDFNEMSEVALRIDQPAHIATAPNHETFKDENGKVREENCRRCEAVFAIARLRMNRTQRSFADLADQLQLKLEEDHKYGTTHRSAIPLRSSEPTRT